MQIAMRVSKGFSNLFQFHGMLVREGKGSVWSKEMNGGPFDC